MENVNVPNCFLEQLDLHMNVFSSVSHYDIISSEYSCSGGAAAYVTFVLNVFYKDSSFSLFHICNIFKFRENEFEINYVALSDSILKSINNFNKIKD